jgi:hypothetical protein
MRRWALQRARCVDANKTSVRPPQEPKKTRWNGADREPSVLGRPIPPQSLRCGRSDRVNVPSPRRPRPSRSDSDGWCRWHHRYHCSGYRRCLDCNRPSCCWCCRACNSRCLRHCRCFQSCPGCYWTRCRGRNRRQSQNCCYRRRSCWGSLDCCCPRCSTAPWQCRRPTAPLRQQAERAQSFRTLRENTGVLSALRISPLHSSLLG